MRRGSPGIDRKWRACVLAVAACLAGCSVPVDSGPTTVGSIGPSRPAPRKPVPEQTPGSRPKVLADRRAPVRTSPPPLCNIGRGATDGDVVITPNPCAVSLRPTLQP